MRSTNWSENELRESVKAYIEMLKLENSNVRYNKAAIIRGLMSSHLKERTRGSIERRFSNISSVLNDMGRPWVKGYKPASHVGENVKAHLIQFILELDENIDTDEPIKPLPHEDIFSTTEILPMPTRGPAPREQGYTVSPKLDGVGNSHVYVARFSQSNIFKIGYSANPSERLSNFNEHIPSSEMPELGVWKIFFVSEQKAHKEAYRLEQQILLSLSNSRTVGERVQVSEERMLKVLEKFFVKN